MDNQAKKESEHDHNPKEKQTRETDPQMIQIVEFSDTDYEITTTHILRI